MTRGILNVGMGWFAEEPGGLNRMYAGLYKALVESGVRVQGLVAGDPASAVAAPPGIRFFARRDASFLKRLATCRSMAQEVLRREAIDVVAAHFSPYALPLLDVIGRKPFVFHFHGPWAEESQVERQRGLRLSAKRLIEALVYRRADRVIVLSRAFAEVLSTIHGVPPERVHVIPGGVDVDRFAVGLSRHEARASMQLPTDRPIVGVVRRLVHRVGLESLLEAMTAIRQRVPDVLLVIAGRGPLASDLAARVASAGLQRHVRFLGFVSDDELPILYRACDVSIVPSAALEGFGLTTIESLAAGTPVLVTPIGGLPESVAGLDAGLVLGGTGVSAIAEGLSEVLGGERSVPSAEECRRYARNNFDWPIIARKVLNVYA